MQIALTIAGSDSGGGAGIQADLKTFQRFGVYGTSVLTAVTAQNTFGVMAVHVIPVDIVRAQLAALAADLPAAAFKTGMLGSLAVVQAVADTLDSATPYVCDPVMVASSGDRLLEADAEAAVRDRLLPLASLVTPNLDETEILAGFAVHDPDSMERAGRVLLERGAAAALIKGGHLAGDALVDILITRLGTRRFEHARLATQATHGTGCTLSAAITAGLALGHPLEEAVETGLTYVRHAIETAPGLGGGRGPLG